MIEETVFNYLNYHLSAPVYISKPKNTGTVKEFFLLEKTGTGLNNKISQATFALQSYASSKYRAAALMEEAKAAMLDGLITLDVISNVELNGGGDFTDTTKKEPRYQSVFVVTHY